MIRRLLCLLGNHTYVAYLPHRAAYIPHQEWVERCKWCGKAWR